MKNTLKWSMSAIMLKVIVNISNMDSVKGMAIMLN